MKLIPVRKNIIFIEQSFFIREMLKQANMKLFIHFYLVVVCSTQHWTYGASSDKSTQSKPAGSENSEKPEFENCLLMEGDISGQDPFINDAINQLFMVSQAW